MIPCCRIESTSSCSASRPKSFRGCNALGTMLARLIWCTLSPASAPSLGAETAGVPMSAPRPLPKPERAMRLRLPEQTPQRKQHCAERFHIMEGGGAARRLTNVPKCLHVSEARGRSPLNWFARPKGAQETTGTFPTSRNWISVDKYFSYNLHPPSEDRRSQTNNQRRSGVSDGM
jgi:hypothetical protein